MLSLKSDNVVTLLKPLYGDAVSGNCWGKQLELLGEKAKNIIWEIESFLIFPKNGETLPRPCATNVDDTIHEGNNTYSWNFVQTENLHKCSNQECNKITLLGLEIETSRNVEAILKKRYISDLEKFCKSSFFVQFPQFQAKLSWHLNSYLHMRCA